MEMNIEEVIIWEDIDTHVPICSLKELDRIISSQRNNSPFTLVDISIKDPIYLNLIFLINDIHDGLKINKELFYKRGFLISGLMYKQIQKLISDYRLESIQNLIFKIIAILNSDFSDWQNIIVKDESIIKQLEQYNKGEAPLRDAIKLYSLLRFPDKKFPAKYEMNSITIQFSVGESKKISHPYVISNIMNCLMDNYDLESKDKIDFEGKLSKLKYLISKSLLTFLRMADKEWFIIRKVTAYEIIALIFTCAGLKTNAVTIREWIKRADK